MNENIPLDGTNTNDVTADKDEMSLLIIRQAFIDATRKAFEQDEKTDEITDKETEKEE